MSDEVYLKSFEEKTSQKVESYRDAYIFTEDYTLLLHLNTGDYEWGCKVGYISNCGSVPKIFQWFVKSYDSKNPRFNAAFFFHDDGYQKKGYGKFTRSDIDAICRGMLRESGCDRVHASMVDFAVGIGASKHWGTNEYHNLECMSYLKKV